MPLKTFIRESLSAVLSERALIDPVAPPGEADGAPDESSDEEVD